MLIIMALAGLFGTISSQVAEGFGVPCPPTTLHLDQSLNKAHSMVPQILHHQVKHFNIVAITKLLALPN